MSPGESRQGGFSLIEVVVALVLLMLLLASAQAAMTSQMIRGVGDADAEAIAQHVALSHLEWIRADPRYGELASYAGREPVLHPDEYAIRLPGAERIVSVRRVQNPTDGGGVEDYTVVTVTVETPPHGVLAQPVSRTTVIAAP